MISFDHWSQKSFKKKNQKKKKLHSKSSLIILSPRASFVHSCSNILNTERLSLLRSPPLSFHIGWELFPPCSVPWEVDQMLQINTSPLTLAGFGGAKNASWGQVKGRRFRICSFPSGCPAHSVGWLCLSSLGIDAAGHCLPGRVPIHALAF